MSIRSRLFLLTLVATLFPALLGLGRFLHAREQAIQADTARLAVIAQRQADAIADKVQGTAQLHFGLARAQDLFTDDRVACSAFLSQVLAAYPQYTGILTIKPDGQLFCDSLQSGRDLDLRDRAYFQAALAAHDEVVLEPTFGRLTGAAVLQIAYPVRSTQDDLEFVLLASLDLQRLLEVEGAVPDARLLVVDDRGTVLATSQDDVVAVAPGESIAGTDVFAFVAANGDRTREIAASDGRLEVWAIADPATLAAARLRVAAVAPQAALVAPADLRFEQDLVVLATVALGAFLAVWLVARIAIQRPITRISSMAEQLARGDLSARIAGPLPHGELGHLMSTLNQAAAALEERRADIARLNEHLRHSQRMESIGQLTGGVAHDFNNLLTVVIGNAELIASDPDATPDQRELALTIGSAAQGGAQLTQRLLAFARRQALAPTVVDINALVAEMAPMLRSTLGEHIEIGLVRAPDLWPALVDRGQLENALLNLCVNARDAMAAGGRMTVETANVQLEADDPVVSVDQEPGPYVMLAVSDTGIGIEPERLPRVFEPFFTDKERGKGTGLGLAMVYGFVKQSAGHVTIESELGRGTVVKLYLPRADAQPGAAAAPTSVPAPSTDIVGGSETILLVEDDPEVRRYGLNQLRGFGYRTLEAADGPAALAIIERGDDVDLLFTDVVMPGGIDGRALADAARALRPGLRVLYTSGYTEDAIVHHGRLDADARLLPKPYRRNDLARAIRDALDSDAPKPSRS